MEKKISKSISKCDLIEYVVSHPDINYVAMVVSPGTFINARVVLHYLHEQMGLQNPKGIFVVNPWQPNKWAIESELPMAGKCEFFYNHIWMKMEQEYEGRKTRLMEAIGKARINNTSRIRKVYVIHIDAVSDSFAVYGKAFSDIDFEHYYLDAPREPYYSFGEWFHIMRARISFGVSYYMGKLRTGIVRKLILGVSGITVHKVQVWERKTFFSKEYCKYIKMVLAEEGEGYKFSPSRKYVLYLSNAYDDTTSKQITEIAENVLSIFEKKGYEIYVKQHPRECSQLYFKDITPQYLPNKYAVESLVAVAEEKPSAVIGAESTALANIAAFWKIPCYCLLDHPLLWNKRKFEWFRGYNDCAMRGIPEFKYSRHLNEFFYKENR